MKIIWVGISNQKDKLGIALPPFSENTPTGVFLEDLIELLPNNYQHTKINYINRVLLTENQKLRNPKPKELDTAWLEFLKLLENKEECLFVLFSGVLRQSVSKKICTKAMSKYELFQHKKNQLVFFDHPSYINIYKRKLRSSYLEKMAEIITSGNR